MHQIVKFNYFSTSLADLPYEILYQILKPLLPVLDRNSRQRRISYLHNPSMASPETYRLRLKFFADYRLICRAMDHFVRSLLFENLMLLLQPNTRLEPIQAIFDHFPHLISSLSIEACEPLGGLAEPAGHVIHRGLEKCTNLRTLECHGYHPIFGTPGHVPNFPNPAGITSVSITPRKPSHFMGVAYLGSTLKSLQLYDGYISCINALSLPAPFPQLEELTLVKKTGLTWPHVASLLLRIGPYDPIRLACRSSLYTLNIVSLKISAQCLHNLLSENEIGARLTTFRYVYSHRWCGGGYDVQQSMGPILSACPNLKALYLGCPAFPTNFAWIPPLLEQLTLFVPIEHVSIIPWVFSYIDWVQCRRSQILRSITFLSTPLVPERLTLKFKERCREVGARAEIVYDPWMNTDGIKLVFS